VKNLTLAASLVLSLSAGVHAALTVYEPFRVGSTPASGEYTTTQITGQGPIVGGYLGNWINGNATATVTANGLNFPGLLTTDGALLASSGASREGRLLSSPFNAATVGTFYLSVLIDLSVSSGGNYKAFELHNGGFNDGTNRILQIGQGGTGTDFAGTTNFGLRLFSNDSFRINLGLADTDTNLFVVRFDLSAVNNADVVTVYRNPTSLDLEPLVPAGTLTNFNLAFDRTSVGNFQANGDSITVDEIRIGDTYSSVLPVPEPATGALVLLGTAMALRRRRRV
jgi:opacity protein-like surface antigen